MTGSAGKYKVSVNGIDFVLDADELKDIDLIASQTGEFNLVKDNRSINAIVRDGNPGGNSIEVEINGHSFHVEIKDELAQQLEIMGFSTKTIKEIKEIRAPMPGLVLEVHTQEGQSVSAGDKILILEAMKMENSIIIHSTAIIKKINVVTGQAVEKGQLLVELE